jgi:hypothetical protein
MSDGRTKVQLGHCHRLPPQVFVQSSKTVPEQAMRVGAGPNGNLSLHREASQALITMADPASSWPLLKVDDWCGEFDQRGVVDAVADVAKALVVES